MANAGILWPIARRNMAMEVGKELTLLDVPLCRLKQYKTLHTSSTILVPGYKFKHFRGTGLWQVATK
jgi:hypothetical protein